MFAQKRCYSSFFFLRSIFVLLDFKYKIMIQHVVMWKIKDHDKESNALKIQNKLLALKKCIEQIITIDVYINDKQADSSNFDVILTMKVKSYEDLAIYQKHPEHIKVGAFIRDLVLQRAAIDFTE